MGLLDGNVAPEPYSAEEHALIDWFTSSVAMGLLRGEAYDLRSACRVTHPQRYYQWLSRQLERPQSGHGKKMLMRALEELRSLHNAWKTAPREETIKISQYQDRG